MTRLRAHDSASLPGLRPGRKLDILWLAGACLALALGAGACTDREAERLKATTKPTYDNKTGLLKELTFDANRNGRIDTWTDMDGARPVRSRIDRDEDGRIDRWEYYDQQGVLTRVGFSRSGAEVPDAWAYSAPSGRVERVEMSSKADETKIDRWEHYDLQGPAREDGSGLLLRAEEDTNGDGKPDRWETYDGGGVLVTVEFDENGDGVRDRRLTYKDSQLVLIETAPDAGGHYTKKIDGPS
jgi:hypothetical protein